MTNEEPESLESNIKNEIELEKYLTCEKCKEKMISCAFGIYMCPNCGEQIALSEEEIKENLTKSK